ncbi:MAG: bacteriohemerythrin [Deltaproteobacteria bacterium]
MKLIWLSSAMATGLDWQDAEHRELFNRANALIEAMEKNRGKEELASTFKFLDDYIKGHFRKEEVQMEQLKYGDYLTHKQMHQKFVLTISGLKGKLNSLQEPKIIAEETRKFLSDWLYEHIAKTDKKLGAFLVSGQSHSKAV